MQFYNYLSRNGICILNKTPLHSPNRELTVYGDGECRRSRGPFPRSKPFARGMALEQEGIGHTGFGGRGQNTTLFAISPRRQS